MNGNVVKYNSQFHQILINCKCCCELRSNKGKMKRESSQTAKFFLFFSKKSRIKFSGLEFSKKDCAFNRAGTQKSNR